MTSQRLPRAHTSLAPAVSLALIAFIVVTVLAAVQAAPAAADDPGVFAGQFLIGYRTVDVGGQEAKYREDLDYDDGPRLFDLSFHFLPADGLRGFADRVDLEVANVGGDPFETLHLGIRKYGAFKFRYHRTKSTYFYDDVILPVALADFRLSNAGDLHRFDLDRVRDTARLDIDLNRRAKVNLGFERSTKAGESTTTLEISRDQFQLDRSIDESLNAFSAGLQYAWDKLTVVVEEEVRVYENSVELFLPGPSLGEDPAGASLDLFSLDQPYDYTSRRHTVRVIAHPDPRLSMRLAASVESLDLELRAVERSEGVAFDGVPFTDGAAGRGAIERKADLVDLDLSFRLNHRFSLIGGVYTRQLDQDGEVLFAGAPKRGRWDIETTGGEAGIQIEVSPQLTLAGGLRGESRDVTWYIESGRYFTSTTDHTGYFATAGWRPSRRFRFDASIETNSYDDPFTLASPTERSRFRVRGRRDFAGGGFVSGTYLRLDADNDNSGWNASYEQVNVQLGYQRPGLSASIGWGAVAIDRSITQATDGGALPIAYRADGEFIDGRGRWNPTEPWTLGVTVRRYRNDGSFALDRDDLHGFAEFAFRHGYLIRAGYRSVDYDEVASAFDDYRADILEIAVGYRW